MRQGTCKLCFTKDVELLRSHYLPRALYALCRGEGDPIFQSPNLSIPAQKQIADYLLCRDCEKRFDYNGENYVMRMVHRGNEFRIMELIRQDQWCRRVEGKYSVYSASRVGIDTTKLAYFALSVLWRGSVHVWETFEGRKTGGLNLEAFQDILRRYLVGKTAFPLGVAVQVSVSCDWESCSCCQFPVEDADQESVFTFLTCGIWFDIMLADPLPPHAALMCCASSKEKPIFVVDENQFLTHRLSSYRETARTSKKLAN